MEMNSSVAPATPGESLVLPDGTPATRLISWPELQCRTGQLAKEIDRDYSGRPLVILGVLKGAAPFTVDLFMRLDHPVVELDWVEATSYGGARTSSGVVRIIKHPSGDLRGKDVIVVDDVLDSGRTLRWISGYVLGLGANTVEIASLLLKPGRPMTGPPIKYVGFGIADRFVVGYGMDIDQWGRNLRGVYEVEDSE